LPRRLHLDEFSATVNVDAAVNAPSSIVIIAVSFGAFAIATAVVTGGHHVASHRQVVPQRCS
jgi:hypothetical protein